ncbi:hypothetical protein [Gorillibacterium sp. sgz500922]|uniref:hypothetical protein n=1 Tax=Gorillibacterium sp. sgz500922 TaxID=3446694 RepID=UPI003F67CB42
MRDKHDILRTDFPLPEPCDILILQCLTAAAEDDDEWLAASQAIRSLRKHHIVSLGDLLNMSWNRFSRALSKSEQETVGLLLLRLSDHPEQYFHLPELQERYDELTSSLDEKYLKNQKILDKLRALGLIK